MVFAAASLFLTVAYGLLSKKILTNKEGDLDPIAYASAVFIFVGFLTMAIYILNGIVSPDFQSLLNPKILFLLILNLVFYTIAPSFYYHALKNLPFSLITIIYSLSGFMAFVVGAFLKVNTFDITGLFGSLLIIFSVILVTLRGNEIKKSRFLLFAFIATIVYSLAAVMDSQLLSYFSTSFYLSLTFGIPGFLLLLFNRISWQKIRKPYQKGNYLVVITYGLFVAASFYSVFQAYRIGGTAAQVYSLLALEAVVAVIAAAVFLDERKNLPLKVIAAIIAGLGVYLLAV